MGKIVGVVIEDQEILSEETGELPELDDYDFYKVVDIARPKNWFYEIELSDEVRGELKKLTFSQIARLIIENQDKFREFFNFFLKGA